MNKSIVAVALAASLGGGVGYAAQPEPEVVTKEVEVVKEVEVLKEVKVPGPEVKVVPEACTVAIDAARQVAGSVGRFVEATSRYPELVPKAAQAGIDTDPVALGEVTDVVQEINAAMNKETETVGPLVKTFNENAENCK